MHIGSRSSTSRRGRAARGARLAISVTAVALALAACGSSSKSGSPTTQALSAGVSTGSSTSTPSTSSSPTTAAAAGSSNSAPSTLVLPLCKMLKQSTVVQVLGPSAGTCQDFAPEGEAGRCLWGTLGASTNTVQLTAFTGAGLAAHKVGWTTAFPAVPGTGHGAWSRGPISIGKEINVVLYVDYGSFGMEFAVSAPNATLAMAVTLAKSVG